nr:MAG TPA: hypothetical protein [Inoviridae sp.]
MCLLDTDGGRFPACPEGLRGTPLVSYQPFRVAE